MRVIERTLLPKYCKLLKSSASSSNCLHCPNFLLLAQKRNVKCSMRVMPGPQADQSTCLNVGFIVRSTVSLTYTGSVSPRISPSGPVNFNESGTYQPSTPSTCTERKTSAILSAVTFSSFSCRRCGVALAHSSVLRLRIFFMLGRCGVRGTPFVLPLLRVGLPLVGPGSSASSMIASSATLLRSLELLECPNAFCSRKATSFAGDTSVLGNASSSIVLPRCRAGMGDVRERLRREMETRLRSLRFFVELH